MDLLNAFLRSTFEYQHYGANIETIGAIGTMFFTILQVYAVLEQRKKIRQKKKTESISESYFAFSMAFFFTYIFYGLGQHKLSIILNGLCLGPLYLLIVVEFFKYHKFNRKELLLTFISPILIPLMYFFNEAGKEILMGAVLAIMSFFCVIMFLEMKCAKKRGETKLSFLIIGLLTNSFWLMYSLAIKNIALIAANIIAIAVWIGMLYLYKKFGPDKITI